MLSTPWNTGLTDANDERADCETCDGVLHQVRRASTQQRWRGAHASIIVGRLEWFAAIISAAMRFFPTLYSLSHCGVVDFYRSCGES